MTIPDMNGRGRAARVWFFLWIVIVLSGCAGVPDRRPPPWYADHQGPVRYALSLQGIPYRYGKASPREGFDCSGLVQHVYERHGIYLPRTVRDMGRSLRPVPKHDLRPGDLLFFDTSGRPYSHVGIYIGNQDFVHAPSRRTGRVHVSSLRQPYWRRHFVGVRRPPPPTSYARRE